jgi:uncharacterized protein YeaO (DUF488 family)
MMAKQGTTIHIKRVYEEPSAEDGLRVLVDRLWPRGIRKDEAQVDQWLKDVAPSDDLRRWYGHDPEKFAEFRQRYRDELTQGSGKEGWTQLQQLAEEAGKQHRALTLVFGAKDVEHSNARVLRDLLTGEH